MVSDIHALEIAFAKEVSLATCIPLCEAYLHAQRTMEAMIVCKRGIKSAPDDPRAYVLLAKVYLAQGKPQKYQEELQSVLSKWPSCEEARVLLGGEAVSAPVAQALEPVAVSLSSSQVAENLPKQTVPRQSVQDFFAPDTLGFDNDGSHIETAGPGRLTIVGFVPRSKTSWKALWIGAVLCVGLLGMIGAYQMWAGQKKRRILVHFKAMQTHVVSDRYVNFQSVLKEGDQILQIDADHPETLSLMAYASAALGQEGREERYVARAEEYLVKIGSVSLKQDNVYRMSAQAWVDIFRGKAPQAQSALEGYFKQGVSESLLDAVYVDVLQASGAAQSVLDGQVLKSIRSASGNVYALHALARYFYRQGDFQRAEQYFSSVLQKNRDHEAALMGLHACVLEQGVGVGLREKTIEQDTSRVAEASDALVSRATRAFAYYVRSRLRVWQGRVSDAAHDMQQVAALDAGHPMVLASPHVGVKYVQTVWKRADGSPSLLSALIRACVHEQAWDVLEGVLVSANPSWISVHEKNLALGRVYEGKGLFQQALDSYTQALSGDVAHVGFEAALRVAKVQRSMGLAAEASRSLAAFVAAHANVLSLKQQGELYCEQGDIEEALHKSEEAVLLYQKGISVFRYYAPCHFFLCRVLGGKEGASEACASYLALEPSGPYAPQAKLLQGH